MNSNKTEENKMEENKMEENKMEENKKICYFCKKKKKLTIKCGCGNNYCLKHHTPSFHNCIKILQKKDLYELSKFSTAEFKKIEKI